MDNTQKLPNWVAQFREQFNSSFVDDQKLVIAALTSDYANNVAKDAVNTVNTSVQTAVSNAVQQATGAAIVNIEPASPNASANGNGASQPNRSQSAPSKRAAAKPRKQATAKASTSKKSAAAPKATRAPRSATVVTVPGLGKVASMEDVCVALASKRRKNGIHIKDALEFCRKNENKLPTKSRGPQIDSTVRNAFMRATEAGRLSQTAPKSGQYLAVAGKAA
jgi:hypothetical protein